MSGPATGSAGRIVALGFGPAARPVLEQLDQSGLAALIRWPPAEEIGSGPTADGVDREPASSAAWLRQQWPTASAVVAVGACGLLVRLIAPLLSEKSRDPAVVVVDPQGRFVIPLLGAHGAGGEQLCQEIAALLGAQTVLTGSASGLGRLALDAFGSSWGWRRGGGDWRELMVRAGSTDAQRGGPVVVRQESGSVQWQLLEAARHLAPLPGSATVPQLAPPLVVSHRSGAGCRWHPPCLWLGIGCERNTSLALLERLVDRTLAGHDLAPEAVAGLASVDRKGDEPALLALAERRGWPLRFHAASALAPLPVPHPSPAVARELGTASVAEAAALLSALQASGRGVLAPDEPGGGTEPGPTPALLVTKTIERALPGERGAATLAVALAERQWAPGRGELHLVGSGPGSLDLLSGDARRALARCAVWVGYGPYLQLLEPLRRRDQLRCDGRLTEEKDRCARALDLARQGVRVALISSGDSGIYGMAGLALELWLQQDSPDRPAFAVHPGLTAMQLAAARVGAPLMHDFCTISLSDRLTPWEVIERRLRAAAAGDFVVALYNPRSRDRNWQLARARDLLLEARPAFTPVVLARQLGRAEENVSLHRLSELPTEAVDMLTLVLVGNSSSYVADGWMVTPRGYPGAALG